MLGMSPEYVDSIFILIMGCIFLWLAIGLLLFVLMEYLTRERKTKIDYKYRHCINCDALYNWTVLKQCPYCAMIKH